MLTQAPMPALAQASEAIAINAAGQTVLTDRTGSLQFAGSKLDLRSFTGLIGYASEVAYVVVIDGEAWVGDTRATSGRMLLLPPLGAAPIVQRFDAARLHGSRTTMDGLPSIATERLRALSAQQRRGIFLGRLTRTRLNVAAPGNPDQELARRSILDTPAVRELRFSSERDPAGMERRVVVAFLNALKTSDEAAVAALMDPVPFGNTDLRGAATDARRMMARALLRTRDWLTLLSDVVPMATASGAEWQLTGPAAQGVLTTRKMGDFIFVRAIEMGNQ